MANFRSHIADSSTGDGRRRTGLRSPVVGHPCSNQRGVALILVLWIFIFLFVVAFDFSASVREEGMASHRYAAEGEGYYLALAGFERGLYKLLSPPTGSSRPAAVQWKDIACWDLNEEQLGGGFYRVRPTDEGGKIHLNRVNEATLRRVFTNLGVEEHQRAVLVDSIMDWRDQDDLHRANGAEKDDYYGQLSPPYSPKNGPFDMVEELLWVRGVTPDLFYGQEGEVGLREIFTVDSPMDRVNVGTASAEVIHALLGIPLKDSRRFVEERCKLMGEGTLADILKFLGIPAGDAAMRQVVFAAPTVIALEAAGYHGESDQRRQVKGVVRLLGGQRGFELLRWLDRDTGSFQVKMQSEK